MDSSQSLLLASLVSPPRGGNSGVSARAAGIFPPVALRPPPAPNKALLTWDAPPYGCPKGGKAIAAGRLGPFSLFSSESFAQFSCSMTPARRLWFLTGLQVFGASSLAR